ncbi:MAG: hypothetical protein DIU78_013045 [Pseudomonadota bacterium]
MSSAADLLGVRVRRRRPYRPLGETIQLDSIHVDAIDQLVDEACRHTGERPEDARPAVVEAILKRGIEALREELGKA